MRQEKMRSDCPSTIAPVGIVYHRETGLTSAAQDTEHRYPPLVPRRHWRALEMCGPSAVAVLYFLSTILALNAGST